MKIQHIAIAHEGSVAIMHFVVEDDYGMKREATDEIITAELPHHGMAGSEWMRIDESEASRDRWVLVDGRIVAKPEEKTQ